MPLVLTRKIGETVMIGDDVSVTVERISGPNIRLSITAPKDIQIHRLEIWNKRREENQQINSAK